MPRQTKLIRRNTYQLCDSCLHEFQAYVESAGSYHHPNRLCDGCARPKDTIDAVMSDEWVNMMVLQRKDKKYETRTARPIDNIYEKGFDFYDY